MAWQGRLDPMEAVLERGFEAAGIAYRRGDDGPRRLDFYLPTLDIYVEVKRFHTPRIAEQMSRVPDIIVIQGMKAAVTFVKMLGAYTPKKYRKETPLYDDIVDWNCAR
jgi:hypothetical protein